MNTPNLKKWGSELVIPSPTDVSKTFSAEFTPETCPIRGMTMFGDDMDGQREYCRKCGVSVPAAPYPEEVRIHPV